MEETLRNLIFHLRQKVQKDPCREYRSALYSVKYALFCLDKKYAQEHNQKLSWKDFLEREGRDD